MPKAKTKPVYYAVARGRVPGIYGTWEECNAQVKGASGARFKKFNNVAEAEAYIAQCYDSSVPATASSSVTTAASTLPTSKISRSSPYPQPQTRPVGVSVKGKQRATEIQVVTERTGWLTVYSDGACKGNGRTGSVAGVGVWWGQNDSRNIAERCPGDQTNNRAELTAIVRVLEETPKTRQPLLIRTDSKYSMKCLKEWLPKWRRNKFKTASGGDVKNLGLIKYIDALLTERGMLGQKVELEYIQGHVGHEGNEGADALANQGCRLPETPERDWESLEEQLRQKLARGDILAEPTPQAQGSISPVPSKQTTTTASTVETKTSSEYPAYMHTPRDQPPPPSAGAIYSPSAVLPNLSGSFSLGAGSPASSVRAAPDSPVTSTVSRVDVASTSQPTAGGDSQQSSVLIEDLPSDFWAVTEDEL